MYDTIDVDKVLRHNAALREELEQLRTETGVQELMDKLRKELFQRHAEFKQAETALREQLKDHEQTKVELIAARETLTVLRALLLEKTKELMRKGGTDADYQSN